MRVLLVTHYGDLYGANRSLLDLIEGSAGLGIEHFVLAPETGELTSALEGLGVPWRVLPYKRWLHTSRLKAPARLAANILTLPWLVSQARRWDIDLVHSNSSSTPVGAWLAHILGKPHVWHLREFGWEDYRLRCDLGQTAFCGLLRSSTAVVAVSEALKRSVVGRANIPVRVVYNGVVSRHRFDRLASVPAESARRDGYTFALLGLLIENKGQEQAIQALAQIREKAGHARLVLAGREAQPGYARHLEHRVSALNLEDRVEFLGHVADPFRVILSADAVLMCSPCEAFGRVTAEAMACGRPVIAYRGGATPEIVDAEVNGLLYDGRDEDLAACMERFMERPEWAVGLGKAGREKAGREYTVESCARRVFEIYRESLGR